MNSDDLYPDYGSFVIENDSDLQKVIDSYSKSKELVFDTETKNYKIPSKSETRLVQIHDPNSKQVFVVDMDKITDKKILSSLFKDTSKTIIFQNAPYDLAKLNKAGVLTEDEILHPTFMRRIFDTLYTSRNMDTKLSSHKLEDITKYHTGVELSKSHDMGDWTGALTEAGKRYAAYDVIATGQVFKKMLEKYPILSRIQTSGNTKTQMVGNNRFVGDIIRDFKREQDKHRGFKTKTVRVNGVDIPWADWQKQLNESLSSGKNQPLYASDFPTSDIFHNLNQGGITYYDLNENMVAQTNKRGQMQQIFERLSGVSDVNKKTLGINDQFNLSALSVQHVTHALPENSEIQTSIDKMAERYGVTLGDDRNDLAWRIRGAIENQMISPDMEVTTNIAKQMGIHADKLSDDKYLKMVNKSILEDFILAEHVVSGTRTSMHGIKNPNKFVDSIQQAYLDIFNNWGSLSEFNNVVSSMGSPSRGAQQRESLAKQGLVDVSIMDVSELPEKVRMLPGIDQFNAAYTGTSKKFALTPDSNTEALLKFAASTGYDVDDIDNIKNIHTGSSSGLQEPFWTQHQGGTWVSPKHHTESIRNMIEDFEGYSPEVQDFIRFNLMPFAEMNEGKVTKLNYDKFNEQNKRGGSLSRHIGLLSDLGYSLTRKRKSAKQMWWDLMPSGSSGRYAMSPLGQRVYLEEKIRHLTSRHARKFVNTTEESEKYVQLLHNSLKAYKEHDSYNPLVYDKGIKTMSRAIVEKSAPELMHGPIFGGRARSHIYGLSGISDIVQGLFTRKTAEPLPESTFDSSGLLQRLRKKLGHVTDLEQRFHDKSLESTMLSPEYIGEHIAGSMTKFFDPSIFDYAGEQKEVEFVDDDGQLVGKYSLDKNVVDVLRNGIPRSRDRDDSTFDLKGAFVDREVQQAREGWDFYRSDRGKGYLNSPTLKSKKSSVDKIYSLLRKPYAHNKDIVKIGREASEDLSSGEEARLRADDRVERIDKIAEQMSFPSLIKNKRGIPKITVSSLEKYGIKSIDYRVPDVKRGEHFVASVKEGDINEYGFVNTFISGRPQSNRMDIFNEIRAGIGGLFLKSPDNTMPVNIRKDLDPSYDWLSAVNIDSEPQLSEYMSNDKIPWEWKQEANYRFKNTNFLKYTHDTIEDPRIKELELKKQSLQAMIEVSSGRSKRRFKEELAGIERLISHPSTVNADEEEEVEPIRVPNMGELGNRYPDETYSPHFKYISGLNNVLTPHKLSRRPLPDYYKDNVTGIIDNEMNREEKTPILFNQPVEPGTLYTPPYDFMSQYIDSPYPEGKGEISQSYLQYLDKMGLLDSNIASSYYKVIDVGEPEIYENKAKVNPTDKQSNIIIPKFNRGGYSQGGPIRVQSGERYYDRDDVRRAGGIKNLQRINALSNVANPFGGHQISGPYGNDNLILPNAEPGGFITDRDSSLPAFKFGGPIRPGVSASDVETEINDKYDTTERDSLVSGIKNLLDSINSYNFGNSPTRRDELTKAFDILTNIKNPIISAGVSAAIGSFDPRKVSTTDAGDAIGAQNEMIKKLSEMGLSADKAGEHLGKFSDITKVTSEAFSKISWAPGTEEFNQRQFTEITSSVDFKSQKDMNDWYESQKNITASILGTEDQRILQPSIDLNTTVFREGQGQDKYHGTAKILIDNDVIEAAKKYDPKFDIRNIYANANAAYADKSDIQNNSALSEKTKTGADIKPHAKTNEQLGWTHRALNAISDKMGAMNWMAVSISMTAMGINFSLTSIYKTLQAVVTTMVSANSDITKMMTNYQYVKIFTKDIMVNVDGIRNASGDLVTKVFDIDGLMAKMGISTGSFYESWKKSMAISATFSTLMTAIGAKILTNGKFVTGLFTALSAVVDRITDTSNGDTIIDKISIMLVGKDGTGGLISSLPVLVEGFTNFINIISGAGENKPLMKLIATLVPLTMILQPLMSIGAGVTMMFGGMATAIVKLNAVAVGLNSKLAIQSMLLSRLLVSAMAIMLVYEGIARLTNFVTNSYALPTISESLQPGNKHNVFGMTTETPVTETANSVMGFSKGGTVPQYFSLGGQAKGTDIVPAYLSAGEEVVNTTESDWMMGKENKTPDEVLNYNNPYFTFLTGGAAKLGTIVRNIFKPKGTDTQPAMLTPGEIVINRTQSQDNKELLLAINRGLDVPSVKPTIYRAEGTPSVGPTIVNDNFASDARKRGEDLNAITQEQANITNDSRNMMAGSYGGAGAFHVIVDNSDEFGGSGNIVNDAVTNIIGNDKPNPTPLPPPLIDFSGILGSLGKIWEMIKGLAEEIWKKFSKFIEGIWESLKSGFSDLIKKVTELFKGKPPEPPKPPAIEPPKPPNEPSFKRITEPIRRISNITDDAIKRITGEVPVEETGGKTEFEPRKSRFAEFAWRASRKLNPLVEKPYARSELGEKIKIEEVKPGNEFRVGAITETLRQYQRGYIPPDSLPSPAEPFFNMKKGLTSTAESLINPWTPIALSQMYQGARNRGASPSEAILETGKGAAMGTAMLALPMATKFGRGAIGAAGRVATDFMIMGDPIVGAGGMNKMSEYSKVYPGTSEHDKRLVNEKGTKAGQEEVDKNLLSLAFPGSSWVMSGYQTMLNLDGNRARNYNDIFEKAKLKEEKYKVGDYEFTRPNPVNSAIDLSKGTIPYFLGANIAMSDVNQARKDMGITANNQPSTLGNFVFGGKGADTLLNSLSLAGDTMNLLINKPSTDKGKTETEEYVKRISDVTSTFDGLLGPLGLSKSNTEGLCNATLKTNESMTANTDIIGRLNTATEILVPTADAANIGMGNSNTAFGRVASGIDKIDPNATAVALNGLNGKASITGNGLNNVVEPAGNAATGLGNVSFKSNDTAFNLGTLKIPINNLFNGTNKATYNLGTLQMPISNLAKSLSDAGSKIGTLINTVSSTATKIGTIDWKSLFNNAVTPVTPSDNPNLLPSGPGGGGSSNIWSWGKFGNEEEYLASRFVENNERMFSGKSLNQIQSDLLNIVGANSGKPLYDDVFIRQVISLLSNNPEIRKKMGITDASPVKLATGGIVSGPGNMSSDSIFTALSRNEYVVNAEAAGRNIKTLNDINAGRDVKSEAKIINVTVPVTIQGHVMDESIINDISNEVARVIGLVSRTW